MSHSHHWQEGDVIIIDNLAVAHKAASAAHDPATGLRILHRTTIQSSHNLDPSPELHMPLTFDMASSCPFEGDNFVWENGYVGFRWGDWQHRATPH